MSEPMSRAQVQLYAQACTIRAKRVVSLLQGDRSILTEWEDDCLQAAAKDAAVLARELAYLADEVRGK